MGPFLERGRNVVRLDQQHDMSDHVFVLHAHFPTAAQLRVVATRRKSDQEWREWLQRMSQPLRIRFPWKPVSESSCAV
jgi:hypothetical protein